MESVIELIYKYLQKNTKLIYTNKEINKKINTLKYEELNLDINIDYELIKKINKNLDYITKYIKFTKKLILKNTINIDINFSNNEKDSINKLLKFILNYSVNLTKIELNNLDLYNMNSLKINNNIETIKELIFVKNIYKEQLLKTLISRLDNLTNLNLSYTKIDYELVKYVSNKCKHLIYLNLSYCSKLKDDSISYFLDSRTGNKLKTLILNGIKNISINSIYCLALYCKINNLENLELMNCSKIDLNCFMFLFKNKFKCIGCNYSSIKDINNKLMNFEIVKVYLDLNLFDYSFFLKFEIVKELFIFNFNNEINYYSKLNKSLNEFVYVLFNRLKFLNLVVIYTNSLICDLKNKLCFIKKNNKIIFKEFINI